SSYLLSAPPSPFPHRPYHLSLYLSADHSYLHSFPTRRSSDLDAEDELRVVGHLVRRPRRVERQLRLDGLDFGNLLHDARPSRRRSEEHTSELQSPDHLVFRLLLEKKTVLMYLVHSQHG